MYVPCTTELSGNTSRRQDVCLTFPRLATIYDSFTPLASNSIRPAWPSADLDFSKNLRLLPPVISYDKSTIRTSSRWAMYSVYPDVDCSHLVNESYQPLRNLRKMRCSFSSTGLLSSTYIFSASAFNKLRQGSPWLDRTGTFCGSCHQV